MSAREPAQWQWAMRHPTAWKLFNMAGFQACWWALILTGASAPVAGLMATALWCGLHLLSSPSARADLLMMAALFVAGPWVDVLIAHQGWVSYRGAAPYEGAPPYWIFGLWLAFSMTALHSLRGVFDRPGLALLLGGLGGPLAYAAGARFGAAELSNDQWPALLGIGFSWAFAMLLISGLVRQLTAAHKERLHDQGFNAGGTDGHLGRRAGR